MIRLKNVHKTYGVGDGRTIALRGIDLNVEQSEFVCIWGHSGSGKSTILNLMGLIDTPDSGSVEVNNQLVSSFTNNQAADFRNKNIGIVFQNFNLIPVLNAVENVMIPLQIRGEKDGVARKKATMLLEEIGLNGQLGKRPDEMSGGQRQRVAIARALIGEPIIVLADEPTANLDSETSENIVKLLKTLNQEKSTTFIFSTHDPDLLKYATRNIHIKDGRVLSDESQSLIRTRESIGVAR